jgi:hypothetical protein
MITTVYQATMLRTTLEIELNGHALQRAEKIQPRPKINLSIFHIFLPNHQRRFGGESQPPNKTQLRGVPSPNKRCCFKMASTALGTNSEGTFLTYIGEPDLSCRSSRFLANGSKHLYIIMQQTQELNRKTCYSTPPWHAASQWFHHMRRLQLRARPDQDLRARRLYCAESAFRETFFFTIRASKICGIQ